MSHLVIRVTLNKCPRWHPTLCQVFENSLKRRNTSTLFFTQMIEIKNRYWDIFKSVTCCWNGSFITAILIRKIAHDTCCQFKTLIGSEENWWCTICLTSILQLSKFPQITCDTHIHFWQKLNQLGKLLWDVKSITPNCLILKKILKEIC